MAVLIRRFSFCIIVSWLATGSTFAAEADRGIQIRPAEDEGEMPVQLHSAAGGSPERVLPSLAEALPASTPVSLHRVRVKNVVLEGSTVLPVDTVADLLSRFDNRVVSIGDIQQLCYELTALYVQLGYVSSGVILPDQRLEDGTIRLKAVEPGLDRIDIFGNRWVKDGYIEARIQSGVGRPLDAGELQRALKKLEADPRIAQVNARLLPGNQPGDSMLQVDIVERPGFWVNTSIDNYRSPSVGEIRAALSAGNNNFTGHGDVLVINYGKNSGLDDLDFSYSFPLTPADLRIAGYYRATDAKVEEKPFDLIDIESESETAGFSLSRPFHSRSTERLLTMTAGLENRRAKNWLLGMPFSFTPGEADGRSEESVAYLTAEVLWPSPNQMVGLLASIRQGLDLFDPTISDDGPDSRFTSLRLQIQYARALRWRSSQFVFRSSSQLSPDSLLALEKFSIGGHSTVRGYREYTLVRDNGVTGTLEMQIPLFVDGDGNPIHNFDLVPFADYGIAWDNDAHSATSKATSIGSVGLGLHWRPTPNWVLRADYGYALRDIPEPTDSLQDRGFQFQVEYRMTPDFRRR